MSYSVAAVAPATINGLAGKVAGVQIRGASRAVKAKRGRPTPGYELADSEMAPGQPLSTMPAREEAGTGDTYAHVTENAFSSAQKDPLSTFALDVDNASYSNVRRFLNEGQLPPRDAVPP